MINDNDEIDDYTQHKWTIILTGPFFATIRIILSGLWSKKRFLLSNNVIRFVIFWIIQQ